MFHRLLFFYGGCVIILYTKNSMKQTAAYPAGGAAFCRERGCMGKINREDMLELTRRMTLRRNCFDRIAGAYLDEEGFVDGTFNKHFQDRKSVV